MTKAFGRVGWRQGLEWDNINIRTFTSTTTATSYRKPNNLVAAEMYAQAGGGGGSGGLTNGKSGSGGSGGNCYLAFLGASAIPVSMDISIGSGGTAGSATGGAGGNGGSTSLGSILNAKGGDGPVSNSSTQPGASSGPGNVSTATETGTVFFPGTIGECGIFQTATTIRLSGRGGDSFFGIGSPGLTNGGTPDAPQGYGGGGGGGIDAGGATGDAGCIIIIEYLR